MAKTQKQLILDYIQDFGSITSFEAFADLGITKLTTRISELRSLGKNIKGERLHGKNRYGKTVYYNKYSMEGDKTA